MIKKKKKFKELTCISYNKTCEKYVQEVKKVCILH